MLICHEAYELLSPAEVMELTRLGYPVLILNKRNTDVVYVHDMFVPDYLYYIAHPEYYAAWLEEPVRIESTQDAPKRTGRPPKTTSPLERLNLKIPPEIKAYLQAAAYRESSPTKTVSLTEYLCELVRADMEKYKDD